MIIRFAAATLAAMALASCAAAQTPEAAAPPPLGAQQMQPRASVVVAPYRFDAILWENDRAAFRIYGRPLEAREPPSSSGIDAWGKRVRWPYMERLLGVGDYHAGTDEGADFYNVRGSRGVGGLGVWFDNKLWTSRNYRAVRIIENGPSVARFEVDYAPWPVDVERRVWETRSFALPLGANFTRMVSTLGSDTSEPIIVGVGLAKSSTGQSVGELMLDREHGLMSVWGPADSAHGAMGAAVLVDPAMIVDTKQDADNFLILLRVTPGQPFVYYAGAGWDGGLDFHSREDWEAYVRAQSPDFTP